MAGGNQYAGQAVDGFRRRPLPQRAGAGLIAADYMTDFTVTRGKLADHPLIIRGCVDPKTVDPKTIERG